MIPQIAPHGGVLVNRLLEGAEREEVLERAYMLRAITLDEREISDLELIALGGFSPLTGFMKRADYENVVNFMRLDGGLVWSIPITLSVPKEEADLLLLGSEVALKDPTGTLLAVMKVEDKFAHDKGHEAQKVYLTEDLAHPGVAALHRKGDVIVGGEISVLHLPQHADFPQYRLTPKQAREEFAKRSWRRIVAFQTRNPIHRAHEYITKCALEITDGLFLHPIGGATKGDDVPVEVRMRCYEALIENYYPKDRVILSINPAAMRYAGPREAIFHSILRKNYGCTHIIIGRDHAGVGNYYGTFDAHYIFDNFKAEEIGITPLFFDHTFYCKKTESMASVKTTPSTKENHVTLSGTKVRDMLRMGQAPPPEFSRPEVAKILIEALSKPDFQI
ncbi:MAG: sulfate adenylyltransferase [bacterium]